MRAVDEERRWPALMFVFSRVISLPDMERWRFGVGAVAVAVWVGDLCVPGFLRIPGRVSTSDYMEVQEQCKKTLCLYIQVFFLPLGFGASGPGGACMGVSSTAEAMIMYGRPKHRA